MELVDLAGRAAPHTDARFLLVGPDEPLEPGTRDALVGEIAAKFGSQCVVASVDAMLNAGDYVVLRPLRSDAVQDENEEAAA